MTNADVVTQLWALFEARDWSAARELFHDDFVAHWPHTGETFRGRDNFLAANSHYPEGWSIRLLRVVAAGDRVVSEVEVPHGEKTFCAASFFELRAGKLLRLTEYWVEADAEKPPAWRVPFGT